MYFDPNYRPLGAATSSGYCVTTSSTVIPATARVGDSGPWYTQSCYTSGSKLVRTGTSTTSYVIEPDTASTVLLNLLGTFTDTSGKTVPLKSSFRVTANGAISRIEDTTTFQLGGDSLVMTISYR
jgi:hypothetical protein